MGTTIFEVHAPLAALLCVVCLQSGPPDGKPFTESDVNAAAEKLNGIYQSAGHATPRHLTVVYLYFKAKTSVRK